MLNLLRHAVLAGVLALSVAGCSSSTVDSVDTLRLAIRGPQPLLSVEQVNQLGQPLLLARWGMSQASLVRSSERNNLVEWRGNSQVLALQHGRLVMSAGLPEQADLLLSLATNDPFVTGLQHITDGQQLTRQVDFPQRYLTGVPQHASYRKGPLESMTIMGRRLQLQRIDEQLDMPAIGFQTTNQYWIEPDSGRILHSRQTLLPGLPPLTLTLLEPQAGKSEATP